MTDDRIATERIDRVERLTNLLALLLETNEPLTLVQIGGALEGHYTGKEATRRAAFERDKALLREIGVPIETVVLTGDRAGVSGYWIDRARYELSDLALEPDEMRALQVAVAAVRPSAGQEALWKLGAEAVPSGAVVSATVPELAGLPALREAAARRSAVAFTYRDKPRKLDPYGLLLRDGFWYVVGRDHDHDELRTFRVDRIAGDVEVGAADAFERPADFDPRAAFPRDPKELAVDDASVVARVVVDGSRAAAVERELGAERILARRADGGIEAAVPCANLAAFRSWLLGLAEHAEVLDPPAVRDHVIGWLAALADAP